MSDNSDAKSKNNNTAIGDELGKNFLNFPSDEELMAGPNAFAGMEPEDFSKLEETNALAGFEIPKFPSDYRSGFTCLIGRPNVGKSTLINALVGQKIAIMSSRPETTRRAVRGIVSKSNGQLVIVDTPGVHKPRTLLGKRINEVVRECISDVDAVVLCLPANEKIGPGDKRILREVLEIGCPVVAAVTKSDLVTNSELIEKIMQVSQLAEFTHIIPVSAKSEEQKLTPATDGNVEVLANLLLELMPPGPPLYPQGDATDEPERVLIAEYVREAALEGVHDELPHSIAVLVEEIVPRVNLSGKKTNLVDVRVDIYVERDSQKGIVIGKGGKRLKEVGEQARKQIEELLGRRVYLDLHVRVAKDWQRDPKLLSRLGF